MLHLCCDIPGGSVEVISLEECCIDIPVGVRHKHALGLLTNFTTFATHALQTQILYLLY